MFRVDDQKLDGGFAIYALYSGVADEFIKSLSQGSTVDHFNMGDIGNIPLLVPPIEEQKRIIYYLDIEADKYDKLKSRVAHGVTELREYRTALISAAVTGKIDVRSYQPKPEQEAAEAPCP